MGAGQLGDAARREGGESSPARPTTCEAHTLLHRLWIDTRPKVSLKRTCRVCRGREGSRYALDDTRLSMKIDHKPGCSWKAAADYLSGVTT